MMTLQDPPWGTQGRRAPVIGVTTVAAGTIRDCPMALESHRGILRAAIFVCS
jgi:hypothetical protein